MSIITASCLGPVMFYLRWRVLNSVCARRCLQGCKQLVPSGIIGNRTPWKSYINAGFNGQFIFKWWIVHFSTFDYWLLDGNGLCNCKATSQIGWCIQKLVCPSDMLTSQHWLCCFLFSGIWCNSVGMLLLLGRLPNGWLTGWYKKFGCFPRLPCEYQSWCHFAPYLPGALARCLDVGGIGVCSLGSGRGYPKNSWMGAYDIHWFTNSLERNKPTHHELAVLKYTDKEENNKVL